MRLLFFTSHENENINTENLLEKTAININTIYNSRISRPLTSRGKEQKLPYRLTSYFERKKLKHAYNSTIFLLYTRFFPK